jgi:sugar phosphate isomerase/epimerase
LNEEVQTVNLAPMKFAICNEIFKGWKLDDTLACAARLGYSGVEIAPFILANSVTDISATERATCCCRGS